MEGAAEGSGVRGNREDGCDMGNEESGEGGGREEGMAHVHSKTFNGCRWEGVGSG
ncbi:MAG: hypothetical protein Greene101449_402 [Candidatus Peregrinibacteria bacterium Greene1014_49]|nr:MAG: hypothetical protein Greene101449_402 [Candidatus Peregrinibacteria bacterium Greene1014_49]